VSVSLPEGFMKEVKIKLSHPGDNVDVYTLQRTHTGNMDYTSSPFIWKRYYDVSSHSSSTFILSQQSELNTKSHLSAIFSFVSYPCLKYKYMFNIHVSLYQQFMFLPLL
jgi:hypothetical protein